jgi:hypothetical protein
MMTMTNLVFYTYRVAEFLRRAPPGLFEVAP